MVRQARAKAAGVHFVVADATALPFRDQAFHIVLASFVLSHVPDYTITLSEMLRVTRSGGTVAVSNWAPPSDPYSAAWNELLAGAISRSEVERASEEVAPWEAHFSQPGTLHAALSMAGFAQVISFEIAVESDCTVEQFLEQRALSGTGRLGRHLLGPDGWARFRTNVREELHARFGPSFRFCRGALIGLAKKSWA
jgi:SAM-dependent methyltransferase